MKLKYHLFQKKKTVILILSIFLSTLQILAQEPTLKETENWIKYKIESHPHICSGHMPSHQYEINFDEDWLIIQRIDHNTFESIDTLYLYIPLIKIIEIKERVITEKYYLEAYGHDRFATMMILLWEDKAIEYLDTVELKSLTLGAPFELDKSFLEDNLPKRMEDAFRHLVKLHGGEMLKEVF